MNFILLFLGNTVFKTGSSGTLGDCVFTDSSSFGGSIKLLNIYIKMVSNGLYLLPDARILTFNILSNAPVSSTFPFSFVGS